MPETDTTASPSGSPRRWQKTVVLFIGLLAIIHTFLIVAWLAPSSPVRDSIGNTRLATYVDPYFQQSWGSLDPNAQVVDEKLMIRAQILDVSSQGRTTTPWFDITAAEAPALLDSIDPARTHLIGRRLATNLTAATFALNSVQRTLAQKDYVKADLIRSSGAFNAAGASRGVVANYVAYDQMAVQFASMYAAAEWDGELVKIQYKVGRLTVPPFKERAAAPKAYTYFSYGWRKPIPGQPDAQAAFDSYLKK